MAVSPRHLWQSESSHESRLLLLSGFVIRVCASSYMREKRRGLSVGNDVVAMFAPTSAVHHTHIETTQKRRKMSSKALVHIRTVRHKLGEDIIGFRLEAAIPNMEGRVMRPLGEGDFYATQEASPSFRKPYFIAESSDHSHVGLKQIDRFLDQLRWQGYDCFEFVGKYQGDPLVQIVGGGV
jgi:hypothetical protein